MDVRRGPRILDPMRARLLVPLALLAAGTRCPDLPCSAPSRAAYGAAVRRFVARFPQVRTYTTWNEANHVSQPTASRPELVAGYYGQLRAACPGCTVVAGDVLDSGAFVRWIERFRAATTPSPRLWGLHNYSDVTYGRTSGTDAMLAAVPGRLWIEETGGIVTLRDAAGRVTLATDEARPTATLRIRVPAVALRRARAARRRALRLALRPSAPAGAAARTVTRSLARPAS